MCEHKGKKKKSESNCREISVEFIVGEGITGWIEDGVQLQALIWLTIGIIVEAEDSTCKSIHTYIIKAGYGEITLVVRTDEEDLLPAHEDVSKLG